MTSGASGVRQTSQHQLTLLSNLALHTDAPGLSRDSQIKGRANQRLAGKRERERNDRIEDCARCGGKLAIIASIEEPEVIAKILAHLARTARDQFQSELPLGARAPPPARLL